TPPAPPPPPVLKAPWPSANRGGVGSDVASSARKPRVWRAKFQRNFLLGGERDGDRAAAPTSGEQRRQRNAAETVQTAVTQVWHLRRCARVLVFHLHLSNATGQDDVFYSENLASAPWGKGGGFSLFELHTSSAPTFLILYSCVRSRTPVSGFPY
ncbi:hypothetical protein INR49_006696, partial [Caranx melampygus]